MPPEPLRPLKERMKEELEKGLKSEIDQRCDAPLSRVKALVLRLVNQGMIDSSCDWPRALLWATSSVNRAHVRFAAAARLCRRALVIPRALLTATLASKCCPRWALSKAKASAKVATNS